MSKPNKNIQKQREIKKFSFLFCKPKINGKLLNLDAPFDPKQKRVRISETCQILQFNNVS